VDGRGSAGPDAARVKDNAELSVTDPAFARLSESVVARLMATPQFVATALPLRISPPCFSRYQPGQAYGMHVDTGVLPFSINGIATNVRSDLAATLFLSPPESYDGGELVVQDTFGLSSVKLPAGDLVLYPASSLHRVEPVRRGLRQVCFLWVQSMIRRDDHRTLLESLDSTIRMLRQGSPENPAIFRLAGLYHNLLRLWAET
jgi:PKHD-type hydroxylase